METLYQIRLRNPTYQDLDASRMGSPWGHYPQRKRIYSIVHSFQANYKKKTGVEISLNDAYQSIDWEKAESRIGKRSYGDDDLEEEDKERSSGSKPATRRRLTSSPFQDEEKSSSSAVETPQLPIMSPIPVFSISPSLNLISPSINPQSMNFSPSSIPANLSVTSATSPISPTQSLVSPPGGYQIPDFHPIPLTQAMPLTQVEDPTGQVLRNQLAVITQQVGETKQEEATAKAELGLITQRVAELSRQVVSRERQRVNVEGRLATWVQLATRMNSLGRFGEEEKKEGKEEKEMKETE